MNLIINKILLLYINYVFIFINFHNMQCLVLCFRPAGWDSMKKISILYDNMQTIRPDEFYNSIITKVNTRKVCIACHMAIHTNIVFYYPIGIHKIVNSLQT